MVKPACAQPVICSLNFMIFLNAVDNFEDQELRERCAVHFLLICCTKTYFLHLITSKISIIMLMRFYENFFRRIYFYTTEKELEFSTKIYIHICEMSKLMFSKYT